ncbi:MAG: serine/threonine-protein kinase, partial [Myxococcota bacterium]
YLVMEYLSGEPLSKMLLREGPLSVKRMTSITRQMASALGAAHNKGIIHRDLKPDNIFLIPDRHAQTGERIKVLDFGVAKLTTTKRVNTFVGVMLGTPLYMSPEQCISSREVDGRSDIYSLGCIMFEMMCGQPPYVHDEASTLAMMHVEEPTPYPRTLRPDIPANVESLILRCLAKDREARPQSMSDLRAELDVVWGLLPAEERPEQAVDEQPEQAAAAPGVAVVRVAPSVAPQPDQAAGNAQSTARRAGTVSLPGQPGEAHAPSDELWRHRLISALVTVLVLIAAAYWLFIHDG